jgi:hypothetical protein
MLHNTHFYHQLTRKYVVLFGTMFNEIFLIKRNRDTGVELERIIVPITYAPKEKYLVRLNGDPNLLKEIQITLPRMSFEMTGFSYDPSRKQNSLLKAAKANTSTRASMNYIGVPYDIEFELNIYTRNVDDGTQIVEQILPFFNPDYTPTINPVSEIGFLKDTPIILNSVDMNIEHEGNFDAVRYVTWRLTFTMKAYYYGPVSTPKIIRKVDTNIYNDPSIRAGYVVRINVDEGNSGTFKIDDLVYQGENYQTATAYGYVTQWNANNAKLVIAGTQGQFSTNNTIKATSSNASYNIASFDATPLKLVNIHIEPKPNTAEPGDDFGYDSTITEWPDTE